MKMIIIINSTKRQNMSEKTHEVFSSLTDDQEMVIKLTILSVQKKELLLLAVDEGPGKVELFY